MEFGGFTQCLSLVDTAMLTHDIDVVKCVTVLDVLSLDQCTDDVSRCTALIMSVSALR